MSCRWRREGHLAETASMLRINAAVHTGTSEPLKRECSRCTVLKVVVCVHAGLHRVEMFYISQHVAWISLSCDYYKQHSWISVLRWRITKILSFNALTWLVGWQEGYPTCKNLALKIPNVSCSGDLQVIWPNQVWSPWKMPGKQKLKVVAVAHWQIALKIEITSLLPSLSL